MWEEKLRLLDFQINSLRRDKFQSSSLKCFPIGRKLSGGAKGKSMPFHFLLKAEWRSALLYSQAIGFNGVCFQQKVRSFAMFSPKKILQPPFLFREATVAVPALKAEQRFFFFPFRHPSNRLCLHFADNSTLPRFFPFSLVGARRLTPPRGGDKAANKSAGLAETQGASGSPRQC